VAKTLTVLQEVGWPFWNWAQLQLVLVGVSWTLFEREDWQILAFHVVDSFWPLTLSSMHVMINHYLVFWPVLCIYWWWGVWGALERVQIFH